MSKRFPSVFARALDLSLLLFAGTSLYLVIGRTNEAPESPPVREFAVGEVLNSVRMIDARGGEAGEEISLPLARTVTVALVFSPTCPVCERNAAAWRELAAATHDAAEIVAISPAEADRSANWIDEKGIPVDRVLLIADPAEFAARWGIKTVPFTLILEDNKVRTAHAGLLTEDAIVALSNSTVP